MIAKCLPYTIEKANADNIMEGDIYIALLPGNKIAATMVTDVYATGFSIENMGLNVSCSVSFKYMHLALREGEDGNKPVVFIKNDENVNIDYGGIEKLLKKFRFI